MIRDELIGIPGEAIVKERLPRRHSRAINPRTRTGRSKQLRHQQSCTLTYGTVILTFMISQVIRTSEDETVLVLDCFGDEGGEERQEEIPKPIRPCSEGGLI